MEDLLDELYLLRCIEMLDGSTPKQKERYLELVEMCQRNNVEIPFGIEI